MKKYFLIFLFSSFLLFAQEGYLRITSNPSGANIEVDGKTAGKTPLLLALKPGDHTVKATLSGYNSITQTVKIIENEVIILQLTMEKQTQKTTTSFPFEKSKGKLTIITDREDVTIYLNGKKVNAVPPVTLENVPTGSNSVILVSGDYADSYRVLILPGKTFVLKHSFEETEKKSLSYQFRTSEDERKKLEEIEAKRSNLPAKIILKLSVPEVQKTTTGQEVPIWGENDVVEVSFQYKKSEETNWNSKGLQSKTKQEESFEIPKGNYEIQLISAHYKEPTGLINILLGTKKEKIKEYKEVMKKEIQPDTQYTFFITYDTKTGFSYKVEEKKLNTPVE
ncbi:MAG TPA: PEGA domain-containing protein [bacterium]|nr:PEGA domain-containing protein [bacterium]